MRDIAFYILLLFAIGWVGLLFKSLKESDVYLFLTSLGMLILSGVTLWVF